MKLTTFVPAAVFAVGLFLAAPGLALAAECPDSTSDCTYTDPVPTDSSTTSEHGSLPGGDNTKWTTDPGTESSLTDEGWETTDHTGPTTVGNTTTETWTQEQDTTREDTAVNPGGKTPGTDRFDPTVTTTYEREAVKVTTVTPPPTHASGCYNSGDQQVNGNKFQTESGCQGGGFTWYP